MSLFLEYFLIRISYKGSVSGHRKLSCFCLTKLIKYSFFVLHGGITDIGRVLHFYFLPPGKLLNYPSK